MTLKDAIAVALAEEGGPLHAKELTTRLLERGLWQTSGAIPVVTVSARLYEDIKKRGGASRFVQVGKNTFALNPNAPEVVSAPQPSGPSAVVSDGQ